MNEHDLYDSNSDERDDDPSAIDARASAWLDDRSAQPVEDGDPSSALRVADIQFLHVLLDELHRGTSAINTARVRSAMAAIHEEPSFIADAAVVAPPRKTLDVEAGAQSVTLFSGTATSSDGTSLWSRTLARRRSWLISAAAAAALLGVALWLSSAGSSSMAHDAVQRVAEDARTLKDRQYRVTTTLNFARRTQGRVESLLYVRGGEKFVLRHRGPLGNVWMGSNGRQGWLIPALGAPIVTDNPRYPAKWAREEGLALPDLQLTGLLDLMAERFRLSMLPDEPLPDRPELLCQRISGRCDARDGGPQRIELWAHPVTGVAQRLVLEWGRSPDEPGLTGIQLDLLSAEPQPDVWYEVETHRHTRSTLRRIPILPTAR